MNQRRLAPIQLLSVSLRRVHGLAAPSMVLSGSVPPHALRENRDNTGHLERCFFFATMGAREVRKGNFCQTNPFSAALPLPENIKNRISTETPCSSATRVHTATPNPKAFPTLEAKGNLPEWNERPTEGCPKGGVGGRQQPKSGSKKRTIWRAAFPTATEKTGWERSAFLKNLQKIQKSFRCANSSARVSNSVSVTQQMFFSIENHAIENRKSSRKNAYSSSSSGPHRCSFVQRFSYSLHRPMAGATPP